MEVTKAHETVHTTSSAIMTNVLQAFTGVMGLRPNFGASPQRSNLRSFPVLEDNPRFQMQQPGTVQDMAPSPLRIDAQQSPGPSNMYNNMSLGACKNCECPEYIRPSNQSLIRCEACDHAPYSHSRLN